MISSIKIDNFKSLVNFKCELNQFSCLIGLNGAGKSTILQALDFLSQLMEGNIEEWLISRHWDKSDLNSRLTKKSNIEFGVLVEDESWGTIMWWGSFNRLSLKCTNENVMVRFLNRDDFTTYNTRIFRVNNGHYNILPITSNDIKIAPSFLEKLQKSQDTPIVFKYTGSVLSGLIDSELSSPLLILKNQLRALKSLDLLSPSALRKRFRNSDKNLGLEGEKLSAFLSELNKQQRDVLMTKLQQAYPYFKHYETRALKSGWKQLSIEESYANKALNTEARHISDGMLRLMAILAQTLTTHSFLLFDEIENGINPELIEQLLNWLLEAPQQILVTTHSPMILNYLEDEQAEKSVFLVYKTPKGYTKTTRFFDIPAMKEKLAILGVGEVFIDTNLVALVDELNQSTND